MTLSQSIHQTEYLVTKSINIAKESRLNQLYDGLVGKLLKDLVLNGNLVRKVWNCAALCIQRGYKAWKKKLREQTQKILIIACSEREAEVRKLFYERLDSLIETIEVQNREKERNLAQSNSLQKLYSEGRRALDIPPYIEVAEKVFRKRIAIKRYS
jgi:ribosome-binding ATPase YchF (GTP1/OBG family)